MKPYSHFDEEVFRDSVDSALQTVEKILEVNRKPLLADAVDHVYEDKYELVNRLTNIAIIAQMNVLAKFGLTESVLKSIDSSKATTMRFKATETCTLLKEQIVEVPLEVSREKVEETESITGSLFGSSKKSTVERFVKNVKEFHWTVDVQWELLIFSGTNVEEKTVLHNRKASSIVVTQSNQPPVQSQQDYQVDFFLTWILQQLDVEKKSVTFMIDREESKTPTRNQEVGNAMLFFDRFKIWMRQVKERFIYYERNIIQKNNPAKPEALKTLLLSTSCTTGSLFLPILPLMEQQNTDGTSTAESQQAETTSLSFFVPSYNEDTTSGPLLSGDDCLKLLNEHTKSIDDKVKSLQKVFPSAHLVKLFSVAEATLVTLSEHSFHLSKQYNETMDYMEHMLEKQLIKAVGKRVFTSDLEQFVRYHNAKFLSLPPKAFCHAIGRPNRFPFGVLSIESNGTGEKMEPIETMAREVTPSSSLKVPLNAATTLELTGKTYLHGWMNHRCQEYHSRQNVYNLIARARQFSSFILVIGNMAGPDRLQPKDAIIIQNKDEVMIPLLLNELPSAKEFKDAIQSLSPVQRRFAESFRSMQLASSVFGACVIQIKPQLEALLGLPEDSLAKEMKLTQDLMELFVEYQIPSDLLSFDGDDSSPMTGKEKVENVKEHVQAVMDVIDAAKAKQLEDSTMRADMAFEEGMLSGYPGPVSCMAAGVDMDDECTEEEEMVRSSPPKSRKNMRTRMAGGMGDHRGLQFSAMPKPTKPSTKSIRTESSAATKPTETVSPLSTVSASSTESGTLDFTSMPKLLDASIERHDKTSSLRSTTLKTSDVWTRKRQKNLLTKVETSTLGSSSIQSEKKKAMDLLEALSRNGGLPIKYSDLHVILCVTHSFEKDVMRTIVEDNINPIERLELSTLLLGSTIHGIEPSQLIANGPERSRITNNFPSLEN